MDREVPTMDEIETAARMYRRGKTNGGDYKATDAEVAAAQKVFRHVATIGALMGQEMMTAWAGSNQAQWDMIRHHRECE